MSDNTKTIDWAGKSGQTYQYWIYPLGQSLLAEPGNYCFAKKSILGQWVPLYFGQTQNLNERFDAHHKMACAKAAGATHIHARINKGGDQARLDEEADLVRRWAPACNG